MADATDSPAIERVDRWLWFARFFKTRSLAATAVRRGQVFLNGDRVKPSRVLKCGDELRLIRGSEEFRLTVTAIPKRRGPAVEARQSYVEDAEWVAIREQRTAARAAESRLIPRTPGRPDKRTRRLLLARQRDGD
jgi:ribosome-associated heat shock protein Hsp15